MILIEYSPFRSKFYVHSAACFPQAIDFAKDQKDNDLWEDLLKYSETRPGKLKTLKVRLFG